MTSSDNDSLAVYAKNGKRGYLDRSTGEVVIFNILWDNMTRTEKIEHLFDYPYEERDDKVKELWGPDAECRGIFITFPAGSG